MFIVASVVEVSEANCIGCKACDRVCPTEAIVTVEKLAQVDEDGCVGCMRCVEACGEHAAINRKILEKIRWIRVDEESVSQEDL